MVERRVLRRAALVNWPAVGDEQIAHVVGLTPLVGHAVAGLHAHAAGAEIVRGWIRRDRVGLRGPTAS